jgi:hypothetical protein
MVVVIACKLTFEGLAIVLKSFELTVVISKSPSCVK